MSLGPSAAHGLIPELIQRPTSVLLHGSSRPLLNWVMYALLDRSQPNLWWTDVRLKEEQLDPLDPLARHVLPEGQLSILEPETLQRSPDPGDAFSTMIHSEEPADSLQRAMEFLRLPAHTQERISRAPLGKRPAQFALSNCHRLAAIFPANTIQPTLRAILASGVSLAMTWADALPAAAQLFDFVVGVEGSSPAVWKDAVLNCELGRSEGLVRAGSRLRLGELRSVADILEPMGLSRT
ncbi:MAG: hypothetical protein ACLP8Y_03800 [Thermoplasmata archaeon]